MKKSGFSASIGHPRLPSAVLCRRAVCHGALLTSLLLLGAAPSRAAQLTVPASVSTEAGGYVLQALSTADLQGIRVQISLGDAPPGARLTVNDNGQMFLGWQTAPDLAPETRVELLLSNVDSGSLIERRYLMVHRADPVPIPQALAATAPDKGTVPQLSGLANQVVSPGYVVALQVDATVVDDAMPMLQVDRLPRGASFEANADGSRTFYWRTDDKDEGEHVFRFTAINPENPRLRASSEVMIVVGDPTKSSTAPESAGMALQQ